MAFNFKKLDIPEVVLVTPDVFNDERGKFMELFKISAFRQCGIEKPFVQVNHSTSARNVLRGLHFQNSPKAQAKLVNVIRGEIFDVAVDLRRESAYYGKWIGAVLSSENRAMLYIPEGFAHGFCVLSEKSEVVYQCSNEYSKEHERGILWSDPRININWPVKTPILSEKDADLPTLEQANLNI
ncbi:MAG: dTDP-4-dehydrorhamnose 3,5-epimerase [Candidatus Omnitrophica bacterium]|nr:dTDP-4-dehydrorhamnose 3,5-epimerase [Candidatus Omnitrophota bacterium]